MNYFVYILQSDFDGSYYVGHSHNVELRLQHHNDGWTISTKGKRPWRVKYIEVHPTKSAAMKREKEIKKMKSRKYIERLLGHSGGRPDAD